MHVVQEHFFIPFRLTISKLNPDHFLLTWGNHYLMLICPDSEEGEVVGWVKVPYCAASLGCQLSNLTGVLNSCGIVKCATNWNA